MYYHRSTGKLSTNESYRDDQVLKEYGTVILCGLISQVNDLNEDPGLYLGPPLVKRALMKGLVTFDFEDNRDEFFDLVAPWVAAKKI